MGNKYTKRYTDEFKRDAIALVDSSGKTVTAVARELGISSESLRGWYRRAAAESFWALLKEEIGTRTWPDRATARAEVFTFIETFYNRRRLRKHRTFGYLTPVETRQRHQHTLAA